MSQEQLTNLVDVKAYLNVATANDDTVLASLISSVSAFIDRYCGRAFLTASYTEVYDGPGNGHTRLWLRNTPVTAVASLIVDGVQVPATTIQVGPTLPASGFLFSQDYVDLVGYWFTDAPNSVSIQYTAGYDSITNFPDLEQAAIELVGYKYRSRSRLGLKSSTLAQETTAYDLSSVPKTVQAVLNRYRRVTSEY